VSTHLNDPGNPSANFDLFFNDGGIRGATQLLEDYARTVLRTCEADFTRIDALFGSGARFGASNRIQVTVDGTLGLSADGTMGQNWGFTENGETKISIAAGSSVFPPNLDRTQLDEALRAAFVAELAELFLDLRGQSTPTLYRGWSDGEAFSRVCATWLHPVGYAAIGRTLFQGTGPFFSASHWLNEKTAPRSDYVSWPAERDGLPARTVAASSTFTT
jgi:hypothetical protein